METLEDIAVNLYNKTLAEFLTEDERHFGHYLKWNLKNYSEIAKKRIIKSIYKKLDSNLTKDIGTNQIKKLHLSKRLYNQVKKVEKQALYAIRQLNERKAAIDEIERVLYDGYEPDKKELLKIKHKLPKYLFGDIEKAKKIAGKTKFLKEAYLQLLNTRADEEAWNNLKVALVEKARFYAQRIANTEEQRAFSLTNANNILNDKEIKFVKYAMSSRHPMTDICDFYAALDIGYGKGIVPKEKMITLPLHPFCMCKYEPVYENIKKRPIKDPYAKTLFSNFTKHEQTRILGSREKLQDFKSGKPILDIFNESRPKYKIHKVVDELKAASITLHAADYEPIPYNDFERLKETIEKYFVPLRDAINEIHTKEEDIIDKLYRQILSSGKSKQKKDYLRKTAKKLKESITKQEGVLKKYNSKTAEKLIEENTVTSKDIEEAASLLAVDIANNSYLPKEWLLTDLKLKGKELEEAKKAITAYTGSAYYNIGKLLRSDDPTEFFQEYELFQTKDLVKNLNLYQAMPGNVKGKRIYRGMRLTDWRIAELKSGDIYFDRSFLSFSTREAVARSFTGSGESVIFEFKIKEPKHYIKTMSKFQSEDEVLIDAYQPFKVRDVLIDNEGRRRVIMEEIPLKPIKKKLAGEN